MVPAIGGDVDMSLWDETPRILVEFYRSFVGF
jgi:hypothetical protein